MTLGLSQRDINLLYTAFWDIDADGSGQIRPGELFNYFEVEETPFEVSIFTIFDEGKAWMVLGNLCIRSHEAFIIDSSGVINFMEFVCTLWNILTIPQVECASIAYLIKDPSAVKTITCKSTRP